MYLCIKDLQACLTFHLLPLDAAVSQHLESSPSHGGHLLLFGLLLV